MEDDLQYCSHKIHSMKVAIDEAESTAYALAKNISEKQAEHKRIIEDLKKEQRAEILDLEKAHRQIKKKIGVMKFELSQMKKHRAELRVIKAWVKAQHKSVDEHKTKEGNNERIS